MQLKPIELKFCKNCGRNVSLNGQLCARCGADLSRVGNDFNEDLVEDFSGSFPSSAAINRMKAAGFECTSNVPYGDMTIDLAAVRKYEGKERLKQIVAGAASQLIRADLLRAYNTYILFRKFDSIDMHSLKAFSNDCINNLPEHWKFSRARVVQIFYPAAIVRNIDEKTKKEMSLSQPISKIRPFSPSSAAYPVVYETLTETINTIGEEAKFVRKAFSQRGCTSSTDKSLETRDAPRISKDTIS